MKRVFIFLFIFTLTAPVMVVGQNKSTKNTGTNSNASKESNIAIVPVLAQYSDRFRVYPIYFNKRIDIGGRGDILEIEMVFENMTDDPINLLLFTLATYEVPARNESSFEMPLDTTKSLDPPPEVDRSYTPTSVIKNLSSSPEDPDNFTYALKDKDGGQAKDYFGKELFEYRRVPKDPKKGTPVRLENERVIVRVTHLCKYVKNYHFFNEATILVYDSEGKPAFLQLYKIDKVRR